MAFGKRKPAKPPANPSDQSSFTISEKKVYTQETPDFDANKTLTVFEAGRWAAGLCQAKGYPEDFLPSLALNIMWMESRGLPGLSFMAKNQFANWDLDLQHRGASQNQYGVTIFPCPLFATAYTGTMIEQLVAAGPSKKVDFICKGPPILLFSRLCDHADKMGIALHVEIHPIDRFSSNPTTFILYENEFAASGGETQLMGPANVLIRLFPKDNLPPKSSFSSNFPKRETMEAQDVLLDLIFKYRAAEGFTGALPFEKGLPGLETSSEATVKRSSLASNTQAFFEKVINENPDLTQTFFQLSDGDRSGFAVAVFGDEDGNDHSNMVFATSQTSPIANFYRVCERLGWMILVPQEHLTEHGFLTVQLTRTGQMGLSELFRKLTK